MSVQFTLNWDNTTVVISGNSTGQIASYRKKITGGAFLTTGFTPANTLAAVVNSVVSPNTLDENCIYEFKVETQCTINGPAINSNGIIEQIAFNCTDSDTTETDVASTIVLNVAGTDIIKARFTLKLVSDGSIISGPNIVARVGNSITGTAIGLTPETGYRWEFELYAMINGVLVISSNATYLDDVCAGTFNTMATVECPAPESLEVTKNE